MAIKPDKIITFIDSMAAKYNNTLSREGQSAIIDALLIYDNAFLKGNKFVAQHHYLKRKVIELNPMWEKIFEQLETKPRRKTINNNG